MISLQGQTHQLEGTVDNTGLKSDGNTHSFYGQDKNFTPDPTKGNIMLYGQAKIPVEPGCPVADFYGTPIKGVAPLRVQFHNTSQGDIDSYYWTYGNGQIGSIKTPYATYVVPGFHTVSLVVVKAGCAQSELIRTDYIEVTVDPPAVICPEANFYARPISGDAPLTVTFVNTSQFALSYSWDMGDETILTDKNPTHEYAAGTYDVELTAINDDCQDIMTRSSYVAAIAVVPEGCFWDEDYNYADGADLDWNKWNANGWNYNQYILNNKLYIESGIVSLNTNITTDFDVQVDCDIISFHQYSNLFQVGLVYNGTWCSYVINRWHDDDWVYYWDRYFAATAGYIRDISDAQIFYSTSTSATPPPPFQLRMVKTGTNLACYYAAGAGWNLIDTLTVGSGYLDLKYYGGDMIVTYDNLIWNSGCPAVP